MKSIHFISGLPRSGSTLLSALLRQNPDFVAGMSSPLYQIFTGALRNMSGANEGHVFIDNDKRKEMLKSIIDYYYSTDNGKTCFDTSRAWTTQCGILFDLFPDARMVCCVRNVSWIVNSFELIIQKNLYEPSKMFGHNVHMNVYQRANQLTGPDGIVGTAYNNLREAFFGPHSDKLMLVDYDTICRNPEFALTSIYQFCGLDYSVSATEDENENSFVVKTNWSHSFDNVSYSADEFDREINTPGLHTVRSKIERQDPGRVPVIPPDIFAAHFEQDFWNNQEALVKSNAVVI